MPLNQVLIDSMLNYLNEKSVTEEKEITLQEVIIISRMSLRLQIELASLIKETYRNILDSLGLMAQNAELMRNQLNNLERKCKKL